MGVDKKVVAKKTGDALWTAGAALSGAFWAAAVGSSKKEGETKEGEPDKK